MSGKCPPGEGEEKKGSVTEKEEEPSTDQFLCGNN
jgi:hypothetical protein